MSHEKGTWYANNFFCWELEWEYSRYLVVRPFKWWCCFLTLQVLIGTHIPMIGLFFLITTTHLSEAIDLFEDIIAFKEDLINGNKYHKYLLIQSNRTYLFISIFVFLFVCICALTWLYYVCIHIVYCPLSIFVQEYLVASMILERVSLIYID